MTEEEMRTLTEIPEATPDQSHPRGAVRGRSVHQQTQRLRLLQHSIRCDQNPCPRTEHCPLMKELWQHILMAGCELESCEVPHCRSSKLVLRHYLRCSTPDCMVCCPIRASDEEGVLKTMLMECFLK